MSIHTIDGIRINTETAKHAYELSWMDERSNEHSGDLYYLPSRKICIVYTPSQWANQHSWCSMTLEEALEQYDDYLDEDEKLELMELGGLGVVDE